MQTFDFRDETVCSVEIILNLELNTSWFYLKTLNFIVRMNSYDYFVHILIVPIFNQVLFTYILFSS